MERVDQYIVANQLRVKCRSKTSTKKYPDYYYIECWEFPNGLIMIDDMSLPYIFFESRDDIEAYEGDYVENIEKVKPSHTYAFTEHLFKELLDEAYREFGNQNAIKKGWEMITA